jgi:hypothetical protein
MGLKSLQTISALALMAISGLTPSHAIAMDLNEVVINKVQIQHDQEVRNGSFQTAKAQQIVVQLQRSPSDSLNYKQARSSEASATTAHPNLAAALTAATQAPQRAKDQHPKKLPPPPPMKKK